MLRTLDILLIVVMTAAATITYTIKHRAQVKLDEVHKLEANIRLEKDTIDLLKADWALLTQPSRLQHLIDQYHDDLQLQPADSTQLVQPMELPMLKSEVPQVAEDDSAAKKDKTASAKKTDREATDKIATGSVKR